MAVPSSRSAPRAGTALPAQGLLPHTPAGCQGWGCTQESQEEGAGRNGGVTLLPLIPRGQEHGWGWLHGIIERAGIFKGHPG